MRMPAQAPSVHRSLNRMSEAAANGGVMPSSFWDTLKDIGSAALPVLGTVAKAAIPAIASAI